MEAPEATPSSSRSTDPSETVTLWKKKDRNRKKEGEEKREGAHCSELSSLRGLAALTENLSSIPSTYIR